MKKALSFACLLCFSGACALLYQSVWLREFRLIFGASTMASAAVLAIFMGGLGVGSIWLGGRADRSRAPIRMYATLELGITIAAALSPFLLDLARGIFVSLGGGFALGNFLGTVVRLILSSFVLIVPTVLMGGTLPAIARAVETSGDIDRRHLALLYGFNTLGAVAGITLSNFVLFEQFGNRQTLWMACLINVLVVLVARMMHRKFQAAATVAEDPAASEVPVESKRSGASSRFVIGVAGFVGFVFMFMELVWYRMLGPILGGSSFTFAIILAVALTGIGIGSLAYPAITSRIRPSLALLSITIALEAVLIALPLALGDWIAELAWLLRSLDVFGFAGQTGGWAVICVIVVFPAALIAGLQFPLLIALIGEGQTNVGKDTGVVYLSNTIGSILGSLAGGFGLLPLLSATGAWRAVVILLILLAVATCLRARNFVWLAAIFSAFALLFASYPGPTAVWRHSGIGAGRGGPFPSGTLERRGIENETRGSVLWQEDGVESGVAVLRRDGLSFVVNGKADGHIYLDAGTQVMSGLLGALLADRAESICIIGLGTGSTAGWVATLPDVKKVDVVELEPSIKRVAEDCALANKDVLNNPKVNLLLGDGREWLLTTDQKYDVIFSEPSNPYRAGISSLFTQEFYRAVRGRLTDKGLFCQWLQAYEVDAEAVCSVYATLRSVFPYLESWQTQGGDLVLIASEHPLEHNVEKLRAELLQPAFREALVSAWRTDNLEGVLTHYIGGNRLADAAARGAGGMINTDDLTTLEFALGRSLGKKQAGRVDQLRELARQLEDDKANLTGGEIDPEILGEQMVSRFPKYATPEQTERRPSIPSFSLNVGMGLYKDAVELWSKNVWEPKDMTSQSDLALALAKTGHAETERWIKEVEKFSPAEAAALRAIYLSGQKKNAEAEKELTRSFVLFQKDPWPMPVIIDEALSLAIELAKSDHQTAIRMYDALDKPFAVYRKWQKQQLVRMKIAGLTESSDVNPRSTAMFKEYGSNPSWEAVFLTVRAKCYKKFAPELAAAADKDLQEFRASTDIPLPDLVRLRTRQASPAPSTENMQP